MSLFLDGALRHVTTVVIIVLGLLALLAPPISLPERLNLPIPSLTASASIAASAGGMVRDETGGSVILLAEDLNEDLQIRFRSVSPDAANALRGREQELQAGLDNLGASGLVPMGAFYLLGGDQRPDQRVTVRAPLPEDASEQALLKIVTWRDGHWQTLPSVPNVMEGALEATVPFLPSNFLLVRDTAPGFASVALLLTGGRTDLPEEVKDAADQIALDFSLLRGDGALEGTVPAGELPGKDLWLGVTNVNTQGQARGDLLINMLNSPGQRDNQLKAVADRVSQYGFQGVYLRYLGLDVHPSAGPLMNEFVWGLAALLREQGTQLTVEVEPPVQLSQYEWDTRGYDWAALAAAADTLVVPAPLDPFAFRPGNHPFESLLQFATNRMPRQKLALKLSVHPVAVGDQEYRYLSYREAVALMLGQVEATAADSALLMRMNRNHLNPEPVYDQDLFQYRYGYRDQELGRELTVHVADATSLRSQLHTLRRHNIRQVAVEMERHGDVDPQIWQALKDFHKAGEALPPPPSDYKVEFDIFQDEAFKADVSSGFLETDKRYPLTEVGPYRVSAELSVNGILTDVKSEISLTVDTLAGPVAVSEPADIAISEPYLVPLTALQASSQPSSSGGSAGPLVIGETYLVVGRNSNSTWLQLRNNSEIVGWISTIDAQPYLHNNDRIPTLSITVQPPAAVTSSGAAGALWGYGVQAHLLATDADRAMLSTQTLGFSWVKQQVRWQDMHPRREPQSIDWSQLDVVVASARKFGINLMFSVLATPDWAREPNFAADVVGPPADNQDFARFMGAIASRYCGGPLKALEVWNEQNLHYEWGNLPLNPAAYLSLLQEASAAIRKECPSMLVISGALTPTGTNQGAPDNNRGGTKAVDDLEYLKRLLQAGMLNYVDAVGAHPSGYNVPPSYTKANYCTVIPAGANFQSGCPNNPHRSFSFRSTMEEYRAEVAKYDPGMPIWPTEFGWAVNTTSQQYPGYGYAQDNDFSEQASWTAEAYRMMKDWGWVAAPILWNLNFRIEGAGTEREQWGIVDSNWVPLPAYTALKELASSDG